MIYDLPSSVCVCGTEYPIRSDYRAVLDVCKALTDPELSDQDRAEAMMDIFYPDFAQMPPDHYQEAIKQCFWFINCGAEEEQARRAPKLMDWDQDFQLIVAPVNRVLGQEIRAAPYNRKSNTGGLHWWTFIGAYYEIGDCLFAQVVHIREQKARGKPLDKGDREFYQRNKQLVDLKTTYTDSEKDVLNRWGV